MRAVLLVFIIALVNFQSEYQVVHDVIKDSVVCENSLMEGSLNKPEGGEQQKYSALLLFTYYFI